MKRRKIKTEDIPDYQDEKYRKVVTPQESDEKSVSGSMPDLESDDDALKSAHEMGIGLSENYEHPKELNIAKDVNNAEEYKRTH